MDWGEIERITKTYNQYDITISNNIIIDYLNSHSNEWIIIKFLDNYSFKVIDEKRE